MRVEVPARAPAAAPHGAFHPAVHLVDELALDVLAGLDRGHAGALEVPQRPHDVLHLGLDHEHHARVPQAGVGPHDEEEVGEAVHRRALVGLHADLLVVLGQRGAAAAGEVLGDREVGGVEPGGDDDRVHFALDAVAGDDPGGGHALDSVGDQVDVVAVQRRVVGVGDEDPLAADPVVGGDLLAQPRVGDAAADVEPGHLLGRPGQLGLEGEGGHVELAPPVDRGAVDPLHSWHPPERQLLQGGVVAVVPADDPRWRALVDVEPGHLGGDLGHDLDGGGAGADHRDALALEVVVVVPGRGVEDLPGEGLEALDVGVARRGECAGGRDEDVGGQVPARGADLPLQAALVPAGVLEAGPEDEVVEGPRLCGDPLDVGLDLGLGRERPRPVRVERERVGVQLRRHVAGRSGVGVVPPGPSDVGPSFEDEVVVLAGLAELDGHREAGETGPHDQDTDVRGQISARGCMG